LIPAGAHELKSAIGNKLFDPLSTGGANIQRLIRDLLGNLKLTALLTLIFVYGHYSPSGYGFSFKIMRGWQIVNELKDLGK